MAYLQWPQRHCLHTSRVESSPITRVLPRQESWSLMFHFRQSDSIVRAWVQVSWGINGCGNSVNSQAQDTTTLFSHHIFTIHRFWAYSPCQDTTKIKVFLVGLSGYVDVKNHLFVPATFLPVKDFPSSIIQGAGRGQVHSNSCASQRHHLSSSPWPVALQTEVAAYSIMNEAT